MDAMAAGQLLDSAASGGASRQQLGGLQSSAPAPTFFREATVPLRWPADPSLQDALGCLSLGGEVASPGPARSPRVVGEVEKRDAGGDAEGEARRSCSGVFSPVCLTPASPSNSGCAPCVGSGRARMAWEVDVGSLCWVVFIPPDAESGPSTAASIAPELHNAEGGRFLAGVSPCFWKRRRSWQGHGLALLLQTLSA